jgi:RHS repeat-associated protein
MKPIAPKTLPLAFALSLCGTSPALSFYHNSADQGTAPPDHANASQPDFIGYRFYNPSMGRWLSRDPVAERGGLNTFAFAGGAPTCNIDYLGLAFNWIDPDLRLVLHPRGQRYGETGWKYFSPTATPLRDSRCPCDRPNLLLIGGAARVEGWYTAAAYSHEMNHVNGDFKPAYQACKADAESYETICMSNKKAACFARVIQVEMAAYYMWLGQQPQPHPTGWTQAAHNRGSRGSRSRRLTTPYASYTRHIGGQSCAAPA